MPGRSKHRKSAAVMAYKAKRDGTMKQKPRRLDISPNPIRPSIVRRICRLPAEKCTEKTKAMVMYVNSRFSSFIDEDGSRLVCHEKSCSHTETMPKSESKEPPKKSTSPGKRQGRSSSTKS
ncbi:hypothetical protein KR009_007671 [Drosophila setifemur]|nr:hypothetical protein KR009_007671 [Drosophila setifemur]